ncbi:hypothetical protein JXA88_09775 [Candidatus Fermentibacteria bacterium]|nr:hypothetical protein [Candidatus Fermentibacteria bacterium]
MSSWWDRASRSVLALLVLTTASISRAEIVEAEGVGTILSGDIAQARDEAIIDARVRALEQAVGVLVDAETLVQNELLLAATVRNTSSGLITAYKILEEGPDAAAGLYKVKISATVDKASLETGIKSNLTANMTVVVQIDEDMAGETVPDPLVESEVVEALVNAGYDVRDREQITELRRRDSELSRIKGDVEEAQVIGLRFLSNLVIKGTSRTTVHENTTEYASDISLPSAHARVTCRMVEVETGRIIGQEQLQRVKDFGQDPIDASEKALIRAAPQMVAKVMAWMNSEYLVQKMQTVTVEAADLPDMASFRKLVNLVEKQRWVEGVEPGVFKNGGGTVTLHYPEKLVYLATGIDRHSEFRLTTMDDRKIVVAAERR